MICGVVAVASYSGVFKPWGAFLMGSLAGILYCVMCYIMKVSYQDDTMETF